MRKIKLPGILLSIGLILSACGPVNPQIVTVEVTRIAKEPQIVTVETTRIVHETQIVNAVVTRIVREMLVVTATPVPRLAVDVTPGATLPVPRIFHSATTLQDGRILLVGGSKAPNLQLTRAEIFDPANDSLSDVAPLHTPRHAHTATLLPDGRVLVVGGYNLPKQWLDDAEVYDPNADSWTVVRPLFSHGVYHTATLMQDGRVLVVGGTIRSGPGISATERVEIFDPQTNSWTEASPLEFDRSSHMAQLLDDGRVLVAGGGGGEDGAHPGADAVLYDPMTNTWSPSGAMITPRIFGQSVLLPDGRILVTGGMAIKDEAQQILSASSEIYDPATNEWTAAADLPQSRYGFSLVVVPDGQVLAVGGSRDWDCCLSQDSMVREIESYDLSSNQWQIVGQIPKPSEFATASLLPDGRLWIAGGRVDNDREPYLTETWLISPPYIISP